MEAVTEPAATCGLSSAMHFPARSIHKQTSVSYKRFDGFTEGAVPEVTTEEPEH